MMVEEAELSVWAVLVLLFGCCVFCIPIHLFPISQLYLSLHQVVSSIRAVNPLLTWLPSWSSPAFNPWVSNSRPRGPAGLDDP